MNIFLENIEYEYPKLAVSIVKTRLVSPAARINIIPTTQ